MGSHQNFGWLATMSDGVGQFVPFYDPCCQLCKYGKSCGTCPMPGQLPNPMAPPPVPAPAPMAQPSRAGVSTLRLATPKLGGCAPCTVPPVDHSITAVRTPDGVQVTSGGQTYAVNSAGLITHIPGTTQPIQTLPPDCDENAILCSFLKNHQYYNYQVGTQTVYNVPNQALLPNAWTNAMNGAIPCTFGESLYDGVVEGGEGSCCKNPCKFYPNLFLIEIRPTLSPLSGVEHGPFTLAANDIPVRTIHVRMGQRYYFFFRPKCLSINNDSESPNYGLPLPVSNGGVEVRICDTPQALGGISLIFTHFANAPTTNTQLENYIWGGTKPIMLNTAAWVQIDSNWPKIMYLRGWQSLNGQDGVPGGDNPTFPNQANLRNAFGQAYLQIILDPPLVGTGPLPLGT